MKYIFLCLLCVCSDGMAQDFESAEAKQAKSNYEKSLAEARTQYVKELTEAAKAALNEGKADEANRITETITFIESQKKSDEGDPIVLARNTLEGSQWTWASQSKITFKEGGEAVTTLGQKGRWEMLESRTCVVKFQDLFILSFDEEFKEFKAYPFQKTTSRLKGGRRVKAGRR